MRPLRTPGGVSEDHPLDAEQSSCGAIHLQTSRVPSRARRTASQLREGSYGRDLGTRPWDDSVECGRDPGELEKLSSWTSPAKSTSRLTERSWASGGGKAPGVSVAHNGNPPR